MGNSSIILYAKWTPNNNTVSFNANGGTGSMNDQAIATGETANLTANAFSKTGYSFAGWATTSGGTAVYADQASYTMGTASIILYAKWTANNNTVTFNANNGVGSMNNQTIATGTTANLTANTFTKTGFSFAGWATTSYGNVVYADQASYTMGTSNVTLYAKWTINQYTVNYNGNGNTGGSEPTLSTHDYDSTVTVTNNTGNLIKNEYVFMGWNTQSDGNGTTYSPNTGTFTMGHLM
jgi:uncharacterized repeat protein (TIGR02543 family)